MNYDFEVVEKAFIDCINKRIPMCEFADFSYDQFKLLESYVARKPATVKENLLFELGDMFDGLAFLKGATYKDEIYIVKDGYEYFKQLRKCYESNTALHKMELEPRSFKKIKAGTKTVELRLYDEKRRKINPGDTIEFMNSIGADRLYVSIIALHKFPSFEELYQKFDKSALGYDGGETADPADMLKFYPKERQNKYGVVGIEIKLEK